MRPSNPAREPFGNPENPVLQRQGGGAASFANPFSAVNQMAINAQPRLHGQAEGFPGNVRRDAIILKGRIS